MIFFILLYIAIYSVADGCGWGAKSSTAAQCATRTFNAYMVCLIYLKVFFFLAIIIYFLQLQHARRSQMKTPREAAHCALLAMSEANESVKAATSSNVNQIFLNKKKNKLKH